jgi:hypothetical protein
MLMDEKELKCRTCDGRFGGYPLYYRVCKLFHLPLGSRIRTLLFDLFSLFGWRWTLTKWWWRVMHKGVFPMFEVVSCPTIKISSIKGRRHKMAPTDRP